MKEAIEMIAYLLRACQEKDRIIEELRAKISQQRPKQQVKDEKTPKDKSKT